MQIHAFFRMYRSAGIGIHSFQIVSTFHRGSRQTLLNGYVWMEPLGRLRAVTTTGGAARLVGMVIVWLRTLAVVRLWRAITSNWHHIGWRLLGVDGLTILPRVHEYLRLLLTLMRTLVHHHRSAATGAGEIVSLGWTVKSSGLSRGVHEHLRIERDRHPVWWSHVTAL